MVVFGKEKMCMSTLATGNTYSIEYIIKNIDINYLSNSNFCLYTQEETDYAYKKLQCYLDEYPSVNENDEEIFPKLVMKRNMEFFVSGEQVANVLLSLKEKKENFSIDDAINALNFFLDNDSFISV